MRYILKYTGIFAVVLCLSLLGFLKSRFKREEIKQLENLDAAFSRADDMLTLGTKGRQEILNECFGEVLKKDKFAFISHKAVEETEKVMSTFLRDFGSGDIFFEHNRIKTAKKEVQSLILAEQTQYAQLSKIWQTAGVCAGLAFGIMFI